MTDQDPAGRSASRRFADLKLRAGSALALLALGIVAVWAGDRVFEAVVLAIAGAMTWELARLTDKARPGLAFVIALATVAAIAGAAERPWATESAVILLGPALFLITPRKDRLWAALWTGIVCMASLGLLEARSAGIVAVAWLMGVVIVSDGCGYFFGRLLGGPKFWPSLSPKKTWSGTIAGWIGASIWSVCLIPFMEAGTGWVLVVLAPVFAFAGQLADIFESGMKRRAGVKDVSNLIPGHGGVMDRFDAISGAAALGMALEWLRLGLGG
jgi:phosphatidate cytidylyltransferase